MKTTQNDDIDGGDRLRKKGCYSKRNPWTSMVLLSGGVMAFFYSCCHHNGTNSKSSGHHHGMMKTTTTNNHSETRTGAFGSSSSSWHLPSFQAATSLEDERTSRRRDDERPSHSRRSLLLGENETEQGLVDAIALKLRPVQLQFEDELVPKAIKNAFGRITNYSDTEFQLALKPHQFLHLHNMKTGGTSVDHMLQCAMKRLENEANYAVPYHSIHECSRTRFAQCLSNTTDICRSQMDDAAVLSYCSALKYLETFGWWNSGNKLEDFPNPNDRIKAFTVLRHPVGRVWSMFRFQTKNCYRCMNLTEIYDLVDRNMTDGWDALCLAQLQNHEVANLLSSDWSDYTGKGGFLTQVHDPDVADKVVAEAISNMKSFFTVLGLTEEIIETARILGVVFPWLNTTIEIDAEIEEQDEDGNKIKKVVKQTAKTACRLPHDNASPSNNRCIDNGPGQPTSHWDLPKHPDQATREAIERHNALDIKLYEAAVQYFELQRRAIESGQDSS